jgi:hypothetical protein
MIGKIYRAESFVDLQEGRLYDSAILFRPDGRLFRRYDAGIAAHLHHPAIPDIRAQIGVHHYSGARPPGTGAHHMHFSCPHFSLHLFFLVELGFFSEQFFINFSENFSPILFHYLPPTYLIAIFH